MTAAKAITLSAETIRECEMGMSFRLNHLTHNRQMTLLYGGTIPPRAWGDMIDAGQQALNEFAAAKESAEEASNHAEWYPLLRRMVLAQIKGDYEAGERFSMILQEHGTPNNEAEFDKFMELAAKAMGARA